MAKVTHAQEVSTGTSESFTAHEMNDPEPHLAILRNRPTLRDEPAKPVVAAPELVVPEEEITEVQEELEEFESELEPEPEELDEFEEEEEPEPEPAPRKTAAKRTTARRKTTDDF